MSQIRRSELFFFDDPKDQGNLQKKFETSSLKTRSAQEIKKNTTSSLIRISHFFGNDKDTIQSSRKDFATKIATAIPAFEKNSVPQIKSKTSSLTSSLKPRSVQEIKKNTTSSLICISHFFGDDKDTIQLARRDFVNRLDLIVKTYNRDYQDQDQDLLKKLRLLQDEQKALDKLLKIASLTQTKKLLGKIEKMDSLMLTIEKLIRRRNYEVNSSPPPEEQRLLSCLPNYLTIFFSTLFGALLGLAFIYSPLGIMLVAKIGASAATAVLMGAYASITGGCSTVLVYAKQDEQTPTFFKPSFPSKDKIDPTIETIKCGREFLLTVTPRIEGSNRMMGNSTYTPWQSHSK